MESPSSGEADTILPLETRSISPLAGLTPQYIIAAEEVTADRDAPLGRGSTKVFKGFWNNSLVAVKILSDESPIDVSLPPTSASTIVD
jgi:hypothetical protein